MEFHKSNKHTILHSLKAQKDGKKKISKDGHNIEEKTTKIS